MREIKPAWIAAALVAAVAAFVLVPRITEVAAPAPVALWVAIQPDGDDIARVSPIELAAGRPFRLHAVLEAETLRNERVFFTEARALEIGGEVIAAKRLRPWPGPRKARVLWFTVEGSTPYREVASLEELNAMRFREIFQPDWGQAWSVVGDLRPGVENFLPGAESVRRDQRFGTQRFQVRIEIFAGESELVPELRLASWGPEDLPERADQFPAVTALLPAALEIPSRVFGLTQIETVRGEVSSAAAPYMADWTDRLIAFSRATLVRRWLANQEIAWEDLVWQGAEPGSGSVAVRPGDLLRVGGRLVWFLEDRGAAGLDGEDWCLDFDRGARVERLGDVFVGEGLVEWASGASARGGIRDVVQ